MPTTLGLWKGRTVLVTVALRRTGSSMAWKPGLPAASNSLSRSRLRRAKSLRATSSWIQLAACEAGVGVVAEEGFFAGVGVVDYVPAVAGEVGAMDDEGADGSFAGGLFEFVGPAAVVGEGLAGEEFGVVGGWVADDAEDDFAFDVDVGVVVPVVLGCGDAVADEDDGGVEGGGGGEGLVGDYEVVAEFEEDGLAGGGDEAEGGLVGDDFHADEVDLLEVGAVVAGGGEAVEGELGGDVFGG